MVATKGSTVVQTTKVKRMINFIRKGLQKVYFSHLYHTNAQEIKVCNSTELFKQILWEKIPYCILQ